MAKKNKQLEGSRFTATVNDVAVDSNTGKVYVSVTNKDGQQPSIAYDGPSKITAPNDGDYKLTKVNPKSASFVQVKEDSSVLAGGSANRFMSTDKYGNFIVGPTTFTTSLQNIRFGVYRLSSLHASTLASTIVTPMPLLVLDLPVTGVLKVFKNILNEFKEML